MNNRVEICRYKRRYSIFDNRLPLLSQFTVVGQTGPIGRRVANRPVYGYVIVTATDRSPRTAEISASDTVQNPKIAAVAHSVYVSVQQKWMQELT